MISFTNLLNLKNIENNTGKNIVCSNGLGL